MFFRRYIEISIGQVKVDAKSNEITAIPELLDITGAYINNRCNRNTGENNKKEDSRKMWTLCFFRQKRIKRNYKNI